MKFSLGGSLTFRVDSYFFRVSFYDLDQIYTVRKPRSRTELIPESLGILIQSLLYC